MRDLSMTLNEATGREEDPLASDLDDVLELVPDVLLAERLVDAISFLKLCDSQQKDTRLYKTTTQHRITISTILAKPTKNPLLIYSLLKNNMSFNSDPTRYFFFLCPLEKKITSK